MKDTFISRCIHGGQSLKYLEKFWGGLEGDVYIVMPSWEDTEHEESVGGALITFQGDFRALEHVARALLVLYKADRIRNVTSKEVSYEDLVSSNVVFIGGTTGNAMLKKFVEEDDDTLQLSAVLDNHTLKFNGEELQSGFDKEKDKSGDKKKAQKAYWYDYGLLCRKRLKNNRVIYVCSGCRMYGTQAAAAVAALPPAIEKLVAKKVDFEDMKVVCRIDTGSKDKPFSPSPELCKETYVSIYRPEVKEKKWSNPRDVYEGTKAAWKTWHPELLGWSFVIVTGGIFGGICFATAGLIIGAWTFTCIGAILAACGFLHLLAKTG